MAYVVDPLSGVTEQWILDQVVPNLPKKVTPEVAKVLGIVLFLFLSLTTVVKMLSHPTGINRW